MVKWLGPAPSAGTSRCVWPPRRITTILRYKFKIMLAETPKIIKLFNSNMYQECLRRCRPIVLSTTYLSIHPSICLSIYLSIHTSVCLSIYLSIFLRIKKHLSFYHKALPHEPAPCAGAAQGAWPLRNRCPLHQVFK